MVTPVSRIRHIQWRWEAGIWHPHRQADPKKRSYRLLRADHLRLADHEADADRSSIHTGICHPLGMSRRLARHSANFNSILLWDWRLSSVLRRGLPGLRRGGPGGSADGGLDQRRYRKLHRSFPVHHRLVGRGNHHSLPPDETPRGEGMNF